jgi:hypothetical protein
VSWFSFLGLLVNQHEMVAVGPNITIFTAERKG